MANNDNLKKGVATQFRAGEEQAEIARRGGEASGAARRAKKTLAERVRMFGELKVDGKAARSMADLGIQPEDCDRFTQAAVSLFQKALRGDVAAFNAVRDIIGEKPIDRQQVAGTLDTEIVIEMVRSGRKPVSREDDIEL